MIVLQIPKVMALISCPECKKEISESALSCPNCGYHLTPEKISELKSDYEREFYNSLENKKTNVVVNKPKDNKGKLVLFKFFGLIFFILLILFYCDSNSNNTDVYTIQNSTNSVDGLKNSNDASITSGKDNSIEAYVMAQQFVEARLVSPTTAKYPLLASQCTKRMDGQKYRIIAYVDSQNSFGATIRSNFVVVVEQKSNGKWTLVDLQMD